jgi:hypothetical protein
MTRQDRADRLRKASRSCCAFRSSPVHAALLDLFDKLDKERCGQLGDAFASEVGRSGTPAGLWLEAMLANALLQVPGKRSIDYELQQGSATRPGDLGMAKDGVRYEFQCKAMLNWNMEMFITDAIDRAVQRFPSSSRSCSIVVRYASQSREETWKGFDGWLLGELAKNTRPTDACYHPNGSDVAWVDVRESEDPDDRGELRVAALSSDVHAIDPLRLRSKICERAKDARATFSSGPGDQHHNILVCDSVGFVGMDVDTWAKAVYGRFGFVRCADFYDPVPLRSVFHCDGPFYTNALAWLSAVALVHSHVREFRVDTPISQEQDTEPADQDILFHRVTLFPRPDLAEHFIEATGPWPAFRVFTGWKDCEAVFAPKCLP